MSAEWEGLLDPNERIIWQGAPTSRLKIEWENAFHPLFFLFFTGFSVFWMVMASLGGGFFWTFGLLFFVVGFYNLVLIHFWKRFMRQNTFYTLTNKRAFIATQLSCGGRMLDSDPLGPDTKISCIEDAQPSIHLASRTSNTTNGTTTIPIGFDDIADGRDVYGLIRHVQDGTA
ncbi:MAG: aspartate carbamoyltransferase catalytic subunit [Pseudomonadota bacterium]